MREKLAEIAESIKQLESSRKQLASSLRETKEAVFPDALEKQLIHRVSPIVFNGSVCAVDGGLLAQEFQGFDLVLSRAVGVLFNYDKSKLVSHKYFPSALPPTDFDAPISLDVHDFNLHKSLFRLKKEITCAVECVKKWKPNHLLLDGSLIPQISDKPSEDNELHQYYQEVVELHKQLYSACADNNCLLAGVIKDSRGKRFIEIISRAVGESDVLAHSNDTSLLNSLLAPGERSFAFRYARSAREHQVLRDFAEFGEKLCVMYLKPVSDDRPLRIEFVSSPNIDSLASTLHTLSALNEKYAYPAVLIEADLRAALDSIELEQAYRDIITRTGFKPNALKLRRNNRPFR